MRVAAQRAFMFYFIDMMLFVLIMLFIDDVCCAKERYAVGCRC